MSIYKVILWSKSNFASKNGLPYLVLILILFTVIYWCLSHDNFCLSQFIKNLRPLLFKKLFEFYKSYLGPEVNFSLYQKLILRNFRCPVHVNHEVYVSNISMYSTYSKPRIMEIRIMAISRLLAMTKLSFFNLTRAVSPSRIKAIFGY